MVDVSYETSEIFLFDEINEDTATIVVKAISELNVMGKQERITLRINSVGGSAFCAFAIISAMKYSEKPVDTMGCGEISSAGFLIFISGVNKLIMDNSFYMWHGISYGAYGDISRHEEEMALTKRMKIRIDKIVVENTTLDYSDLEEIYSARENKWYDDDEMFELLQVAGVETMKLESPSHQNKGFLDKLMFWRK